MPIPCQSPDIDWRDTVIPVARRFDDPYFSLQGGLSETRHVFLAGNGLPERFHDGFAVAELGFGTGLNLLATQAAWAATGRPGRLRYTGFEAFPLPRAAIARALSAFPELAAGAALLAAQWPEAPEGRIAIDLPGVAAEILLGDARARLPAWAGKADAWFLDGFSPAKNPELWHETLLAEVARHTAPGGTFATYTAAGHVRRALQAAGFAVTRAPGFGSKRHMTRGILDPT